MTTNSSCNFNTQSRELGSVLVKSITEVVTGMELESVSSLAIADRAAMGVATELGFDDEEVCGMHDGDKVGASCVGKLVRSRNKVPVNPFQQGVDGIAFAHKIGVHFSKSPKNRAKFSVITDSNKDTIPQTSIKVDHNGTRVAAQHSLLYSCLRLKLGISLYGVTHNMAHWPTATDWNFWREMEGVLDSVRFLTTTMQYEKKYMGAYGPVVKLYVYKRLTSDTISLVDHDNWGLKTRAPRVTVNVSELSDGGCTTLNRAVIEFERRFMGNTANTSFKEQGKEEERININERQQIAMCLDPRVKGNTDIMSKDDWIQAFAILKKEYLKVYVEMEAYKRKLLAITVSEKLIREDPPTSQEIKKEKTNGMFEFNNAFEENCSASSSSDDSDVEILNDEKVLRVRDEKAAAKEFKRIGKKWKRYTPDWCRLYPTLKGLDLIDDLLKLDIEPIVREIINDDSYGLIPMMHASRKFVSL